MLNGTALTANAEHRTLNIENRVSDNYEVPSNLLVRPGLKPWATGYKALAGLEEPITVGLDSLIRHS